ncbi:MAG: hypothetical protein ACC635_00905 [Acidiferrobacterales bacterium]
MSEDLIVTRKKRALSGNMDNKNYSATEELGFEDFEAVAKAVLRQRKISATVLNHLTPQFAEHEKREQDQSRSQITNQNQVPGKQSSQENTQQITQPYNHEPGTTRSASVNQSGDVVGIDADVFDSILIGLAQLIDGQRRFADEFGLKQDLVFSADLADIQKRGSSAVLRDWLTGTNPDASSQLDSLFEDLAFHQSSLLSSLDTITRRTIKYLGPELTEKGVRGLSKLGPTWPHYRKRNQKIAADQQGRYKIIIAPGVAFGYAKAKEKLLKKSVNKPAKNKR